MRGPVVFAAVLGLLAPLVSPTALSFKLAGGEKECFYSQVDKKDAKIAFYFAVQSGGSFESMESPQL